MGKDGHTGKRTEMIPTANVPASKAWKNIVLGLMFALLLMLVILLSFVVTSPYFVV